MRRRGIGAREAKKLGRRIRAFRERSGLTQTQVSDASNIHKSDLSRIENGCGPKNLGLRRITNLARALNVSVGELVGDVAPDDPENVGLPLTVTGSNNGLLRQKA